MLIEIFAAGLVKSTLCRQIPDFYALRKLKRGRLRVFGLPCEAVDRRKQRHLKNVAQYYILSHPEYATFSPRNDIIEILYLPEGKYVRHLLGVF